MMTNHKSYLGKPTGPQFPDVARDKPAIVVLCIAIMISSRTAWRQFEGISKFYKAKVYVCSVTKLAALFSHWSSTCCLEVLRTGRMEALQNKRVDMRAV